MITVDQDDVGLMAGRRGFADAQAALALGAGDVAEAFAASVGWHDSAVSREAGSFAVVGVASGLGRLVGETLRVTVDGRSLLVYVLGTRSVPVDLSIWRTTFRYLAPSYSEAVVGRVDVL